MPADLHPFAADEAWASENFASDGIRCDVVRTPLIRPSGTFSPRAGRRNGECRLWSFPIARGRRFGECRQWSFPIARGRRIGECRLWSFPIASGRRNGECRLWSFPIARGAREKHRRPQARVYGQSPSARGLRCSGHFPSTGWVTEKGVVRCTFCAGKRGEESGAPRSNETTKPDAARTRRRSAMRSGATRQPGPILLSRTGIQSRCRTGSTESRPVIRAGVESTPAVRGL